MALVRPFQPHDRDALLTLAERLAEGVAPWRDPAGVQAAVHAWVVDSVGRSGEAETALLVADEGGEVVGFLSVSERVHWSGSTDAYIGELVVAPAAEGRGIGRALVAAASAWGTRRGLATLTVETGAANTAARRFYDRLGFVAEDVRLSRPLGPSTPIPDWHRGPLHH